MNQCLGFTFRLALIWNNHSSPSGDCMEECSSENCVFLDKSAMGRMKLASLLGSHTSGTCQMTSGTVSVIQNEPSAVHTEHCAHYFVDAVPQERAIWTWLSPQAAKQMLVLLKRVLLKILVVRNERSHWVFLGSPNLFLVETVN